MNETAWKFNEDQVESTLKLLKIMQGLEESEVIPILQEKGIHAISFAFKDVLSELGETIEEIAMDSTCTSERAHNECTDNHTNRENKRTWV